MAVDWNTVLSAASNAGSVFIVGKYILKSVEKSNENLPVILEAIKTHSAAIEELYNARNSHEKALTEVDTIHKLKGCNIPKVNP